MDKFLLKAYINRLDELILKSSDLDKKLYEVSSKTVESMYKGELYRELKTLLDDKKSFKATVLLTNEGKLENGEAEEQIIEEFNNQANKWIHEFRSDTQKKDS